MMLLLENHSLEIPPMLLRNSDGSFRYPWIRLLEHEGKETNAGVSPVRVATEMSLGGKYILTARDKYERAKVLSEQEAILKTYADERKTKNEVKKAEKSEIKTQLQKNKMSQRQVFIQAFKWGFEQ